MKAYPLDIKMIAERLSYCPLSGELTWKENFHRSRVGKVAGSVKAGGYIHIRIGGCSYNAARLAWLLHYGHIDSNLQIDHIDRNPTNNRINNLRLVTASVNLFNRSTKYGTPRYYTKHETGKFQAQRNDKYLGLFETAEAAAEAAARYTQPSTRRRARGGQNEREQP
jgi:hypothetical protein